MASDKHRERHKHEFYPPVVADLDWPALREISRAPLQTAAIAIRLGGG
jgi:hypothetical protein